MAPEFRPVLYFKESCPSCYKVRVFLLEAGILGEFDQREFAVGDERERPIKEELAPHFDKVTFPTVQHGPGKYMRESDDIIAYYAGERGIRSADLHVFGIYNDILLPRLRRLNRENKELKQQLDECTSSSHLA
jgi:glutaredoxin 2